MSSGDGHDGGKKNAAADHAAETKDDDKKKRKTAVKKHPGSCHCGAVRFEAEVDLSEAGKCNCTICTKTGHTGCTVKTEALKILSGEDNLSMYEWGKKMWRFYFCKTCGIHCFIRGIKPDMGQSVNVNLLDDVDVGQLKLKYWDGRHDNWEGGARSTPWPIF